MTKKKLPKKKSGDKPKRPSPDPNIAAYDVVSRLTGRPDPWPSTPATKK